MPSGWRVHHPGLLRLGVLLFASSLAAQEEPTAAVEGDSPTLAELEELTLPGSPHELLEGTVGEWELTIRVWSRPDSDPDETMGSAVGRWILDRRFVETTYRGEVMGRPFEALKIEGFEKASDQYVSTWRDNLGTYTLVFRGRCEVDCQTRIMSGDFLDPVSQQKLRIKGVTTLVDADSYTYESYIVTPEGSEFKNMELSARRR